MATAYHVPELPISSQHFRDLNSLAGYLALLVRRKKSDIGCVAAASDPDDAFNRCQPGGVNEPPTILQINFEDRMKQGI